MKRSWADDLIHVLVPVLIVAAVVAAVKWRTSDVDFCRTTFEGLARGRQAAQARIAWDRLEAVGTDVGQTYRGLPDEASRAQYRREFVIHFAKAFRETGAKTTGFTGWRVAERGGRVVVAADYPSKGQTLLMTLPASGRKQIEAIQWQN